MIRAWTTSASWMAAKNKNKMGDGCRVPFRYVISLTPVAGVFGVTLNPSSFPRVQTEADGWSLFRILRMKFRILPPALAANQVLTVGSFLAGVADTPPSTTAQASELLCGCTLGGLQTTPSEWANVSPKDLAGPLPWYKTFVGASAYEEASPGTIYFVGSGTLPITAEFRGIYEFKSAIATANTPAAIDLRLRLRDEHRRRLAALEQQCLVSLLAGAPSAPTGA